MRCPLHLVEERDVVVGGSQAGVYVLRRKEGGAEAEGGGGREAGRARVGRGRGRGGRGGRAGGRREMKDGEEHNEGTGADPPVPSREMRGGANMPSPTPTCLQQS